MVGSGMRDCWCHSETRWTSPESGFVTAAFRVCSFFRSLSQLTMTPSSSPRVKNAPGGRTMMPQSGHASGNTAMPNHVPQAEDLAHRRDAAQPQRKAQRHAHARRPTPITTPCFDAQISQREMMMQLTMISGMYGAKLLCSSRTCRRPEPVGDRHEGGDRQREDEDPQVRLQQPADQADHHVGRDHHEAGRHGHRHRRLPSPRSPPASGTCPGAGDRSGSPAGCR